MIVKYGEVYEKALVIEDASGRPVGRQQKKVRPSGQGGTGGAVPSAGSLKKARTTPPSLQDQQILQCGLCGRVHRNEC